MRLVTGWYSSSPKRDKATLTAILMVIAMGVRTMVPGDAICPDPAERIEWVDYCMRNTQALMSELVARDEDLLGIQAILALTMLFYNTSDTRPSSILIGTAMKLAHRLQLHSSDSARYFNSEDVQQRSRVFWIAYSLDKVIMMRLIFV